MTKLSKNFSRDEFKCQCGHCDKDTVDSELIDVLQDLRDEFLRPIKINSGHRCQDHNRSIGGAKDSMHLEGRASDIKVEYINPKQAYIYLTNKYPDKYGIGLYKTFIHIDTRPNPARW